MNKNIEELCEDLYGYDAMRSELLKTIKKHNGGMRGVYLNQILQVLDLSAIIADEEHGERCEEAISRLYEILS